MSEQLSVAVVNPEATSEVKPARRGRKSRTPVEADENAYIDEVRAAELIGLSISWLQRARIEGVGPKFHRVARFVRYRVRDLHEWIESGAAGRDHLSNTKGRGGAL